MKVLTKEREQALQISKLISKEIKAAEIILPLFYEHRTSETIILAIGGVECDCWMWCECHTSETCQAPSKICEFKHDHKLQQCDGYCGYECGCVCSHSENIIIDSRVQAITSEGFGRYGEEISPDISLEYVETAGLAVDCNRCRYGCQSCQWVKQLISQSNKLTDQEIKAIKETANQFASDAGDYEPNGEHYASALALYGIKINK